MSQSNCPKLRILAVLWLGLSICLMAASPLLASAQSGDETSLRAVTERFFSGYQSGDLDSLMRLWSDKSPDFASSKQSSSRPSRQTG